MLTAGLARSTRANVGARRACAGCRLAPPDSAIKGVGSAASGLIDVRGPFSAPRGAEIGPPSSSRTDLGPLRYPMEYLSGPLTATFSGTASSERRHESNRQS